MVSNAKKTSRRGFTLTEAAIVLGIMGLILGAIWVAAASVYKNIRISKTSEQLLSITQAVRSMHGSQNTVAATTAQQWVTSGVFPRDMINAAGTGAVDLWNGAVTITPQNTMGADGDGFSITFAAVPPDACVELFTRSTGQGRDGGMVGAGNAFANNTFNTVASITVAAATALCGTAAPTGNNVVFTFRLRS